MPEAVAVPDSRGFKLIHQKVSVDVNLADQTVEGWTELTIIPLDPLFKQITLDCRQCQVHSVSVNMVRASFMHDDIVNRAKLAPSTLTTVTAHQNDQYRSKIDSVLKDKLPGELIIQVPKSVKITQESPSTDGDVDGDAKTGVTTATTATSDSPPEYEPLTVKVEFCLKSPGSGFNFVGGAQSKLKKRFWHAYTTHTPVGRCASSWMPCVDGLWDLCSWEVEVSVPKRIGDIVSTEVSQQRSQLHHHINGNGALVPARLESDELNNRNVGIDVDGDELDDELDDEITVVCSSVNPREISHPFDNKKKVVSFNLSTPVSAQHVGFAVGPFVQVPIIDLRENDNQEDSSSGSIPMSTYCLADKVSDANNSTVFLYKAMEYFTREFGSFPFSSFSLCFVADSVCEVASAVGLAICSDSLLFPPEAIDPLFSSTEKLTTALAAQWCGVSIIPKRWNDFWCIIGISRFMALQFIRKLMGYNEYKFRVKRQTDEITRQDLDKPPLADPKFRFPIADKDFDFIRLKAPIVLFILDRRITKTDRSFGLMRVISKLFLQSMSQDLNSTLSTGHFIRLCERVSHTQLESFFNQWVYGSGYPVFRITQRFNKKRMFIEMGIRQVQSSEVNNPRLMEETFVDDACRYMNGFESSRNTQSPVFTGSMTIRIHEADGTPYEHVVELKESFTKLDIQYNTKYKRLKRSHRRGGTSSTTIGPAGAMTVAATATTNATNTTASASSPEPVAAGPDATAVGTNDMPDENDSILLHCLGDVLQTDEEVEEWRLADWDDDEEERMVNEAFEWMRVDADFEWICVIYINQPDYMFSSQLQQDRDVVAQYEAVQYFGSQKPSALYSSILLRTLVDRRYFYGIREEAALSIARNSVDSNGQVGKHHLMKAFQVLFCFEGSLIPRPNEFSDFAAYFVQKAIPLALSTIRDDSGNCPNDIKNFLIDLLRYNENGDNPYSDTYYVCDLVRAVVNSLRVDESLGGSSAVVSDPKLKSMVTRAIAEVDRCLRMDQWIPSIQNQVATVIIRQKEMLARSGYISVRFDDLLRLTRPENAENVRLAAFQCLFDTGGLKSAELVHYLFYTLTHEQSLKMRMGLIEAVSRAIGVFAIYGDRSASYYKKKHASTKRTGVIINEVNLTQNGKSSGGDGAIDERREALARATLQGAMELVKKDMAQDLYKPFEKEIWKALTCDNEKLGLVERRIMLEICQILYDVERKYIVTLPMPRLAKLVAKNLGEGKVVFKRERVEIPKIKRAAPSNSEGNPKTKIKKLTLKTGGPEVKVKTETIASAPPTTPKLSLKLTVDPKVSNNGAGAGGKLKLLADPKLSSNGGGKAGSKNGTTKDSTPKAGTTKDSATNGGNSGSPNMSLPKISIKLGGFKK